MGSVPAWYDAGWTVDAPDEVAEVFVVPPALAVLAVGCQAPSVPLALEVIRPLAEPAPCVAAGAVVEPGIVGE